MLTFLSPSHHDSACSGLTRDQLGSSLAAQSMAEAAIHDGQYARKLASEQNVEKPKSFVNTQSAYVHKSIFMSGATFDNLVKRVTVIFITAYIN